MFKFLHLTQFNFGFLLQNLNNKRDNNVLNRNKSQSIIGLHGKYDASQRSKDSYNSAKNVNLKNQLNSGIKSDTYESVCPPEDVVERTKQTNKNSVIRNNLDNNNGNGQQQQQQQQHQQHYGSNTKLSATNSNTNTNVNMMNANNSNPNIYNSTNSVNSNNSNNMNNNSSNNNNMSNSNNNNRHLKRVSSAPPMQNTQIGKLAKPKMWLICLNLILFAIILRNAACMNVFQVKVEHFFCE